jgi:hypothetical protein
MVTVNQTVFLLRDNIVFVINSYDKLVVNQFFSKVKVVSLHKLKQQTEDENGYKITNYKVVAINRNGSIQVFTANETNLMTNW